MTLADQRALKTLASCAQRDHGASVAALGVKCLRKRAAAGNLAAAHRAAFAILAHDADGRENAAVIAIAPVEAGAQ